MENFLGYTLLGLLIALAIFTVTLTVSVIVGLVRRLLFSPDTQGTPPAPPTPTWPDTPIRVVIVKPDPYATNACHSGIAQAITRDETKNHVKTWWNRNRNEGFWNPAWAGKEWSELPEGNQVDILRVYLEARK